MPWQSSVVSKQGWPGGYSKLLGRALQRKSWKMASNDRYYLDEGAPMKTFKY